jgi:hypothetical protein
LVAGESPTLEDSVRFPEFLDQYPKEIRDQLRAAVVSFLDPKDVDARSYVLRCLHSCFFVEAGNLSEGTVKALANVEKDPPSFKIFVDTHFLFSVLAFHDNPSNEAADALMKIIAQLPQKVSCRLYAYPLTIDETKHVVEFHRDHFRYVDLRLNMVTAALDTSLSGITHKYLSTCSSAGRVLKAEEYYGPYLSDLIPILRSKGIELYNEPVGKYSTDQGVIDDILGQLEFQKRRRAKRPQSYEDFLHDVVLWHFVREKRPAVIESPNHLLYSAASSA